MNMELSRRQFMKGASAGIAGTTLGALGFGDIEEALRDFHSSVETREPDRDSQHLYILFSRLRNHHVFQRRSQEGRESRNRAHRG